MKCPKCKKEIEFVWIISRCQRKGWLEDNKIETYDSVDEILNTLIIECPLCGNDIQKHIIEE